MTDPMRDQIRSLIATIVEDAADPIPFEDVQAMTPTQAPGPRIAVAAAVVVIAVIGITALMLGGGSTDTDTVTGPDLSDPTPTTVTSLAPDSAEPADGDEPSESVEPDESASLVDGAILLPDGFHPGDAAEADNRLMLVRAERRPHEPGTPPQEDGVVMAIDQTDGDVVWVAELSDGPSLLEISDERVFVAHYWTGGVTALDLSSGDVLWTAVPQLPFEIGDGPDGRKFIPNDIEAGFDSLWMATARGAVARIDATNGQIIDVFAITEQLQPDGVPVYVGDIAISDRHVWAAGETSGLFRIDPESGEIDQLTSDQRRLGHNASSVVAVGADVLVGGGDPADASGVVSLVDGSGFEPVASTAFEDFATVVETHDRPAVWTGGVLRPIDPVALDVGEPFDAFFDDDRWLAPSDGSWILSIVDRLLIPIPHETDADAVRIEMSDFNVTLTYPNGWYLADSSLTPNLSSPTEIFSLASFPLRPGGPNCAQIPSRALHDMDASDVFVTLQERNSGADPSGYEPRPDNFGPTPESTENVIYDCLEPEERGDVGAIHWIRFTDQDRYFYVLVALGRDADHQEVSAIWDSLDRMVILPRE